MRESINLEEIYISEDETHHVYKGKPLYKKRFLKVLSFHPPGVAAVMDETGWYHISLRGNPLYNKRFRRTFGFYEGRAAVEDETGWYHINLKGEPAYPQRYAWVGNFQEGRAPVRDFDGRYFHIDKNGRPVYREKYRYCGDFKYGTAVVYCDDGYARHIDRNGKFIHDKKYIELHPYHKGFAIAKDEEGCFHIDKNGEPIYDERYKWVEPFYNGYALVKTKDGKMGIIDESGRWIHTIYNSSERQDQLLHEIMSDLVAFWRTQIVYAGAKLGVFNYLYMKNESSLEEMSDDLNINVEDLKRLLYGLIVMKYIEKTDSKYKLTTKGRLLWEKLRHATLMWGEEHYLAFSGLWWSIKYGQNHFEKMYGKNFFDYLDEHPDHLEIYQKAIAEYARIDYEYIPKAIDFSRHNVIMDVGGGLGELLRLILKKYKKLRGILFERPKVIEYIKQLRDTFYEKIQLVAGDFLKYIPPLADAIILSRVLHDWNDEKAHRILSNVYDTLPKGGTLYIVEIIRPEEPTRDLGITLNLNMLCITGGKERTYREFEKLLRSNSFIIEKIVPLNILSVIIARKQQ